MIRKCLLITAIILSITAVAYANDVNYSLTPDEVAQYRHLTPSAKSFFNQQVVMKIVEDHRDMFVSLGVELGRRINECAVPFESYEKFKEFVTDYLYNDAFTHILNHYVVYLESIYGKNPNKQLYENTLAQLKKNFLAGADSDMAKSRYGVRLKEIWQKARERCSS